MIWSKCRPFACVALALGLAGAAVAHTGEVLEPVMAGEFALQAGDLPQAAAHYLRAAERSDDPGLAERATRIALLAGRPALAGSALDRWQVLAPGSASLPGARLELALARGDVDEAMQAVSVLQVLPGEAGLPALISILGNAAGERRELARRVLRAMFVSDQLPPRLGGWLAVASLARRLDEPELAETLVREGIERFPDDPRAHLLTADRLRREGRDDEARARLATLGDPAALAPELRRTAARQHALMGDPLAAAATLGAGPQDEESLRQRARWLLDAGDRPALAALYEETAALDWVPPPERRLLLGMLAEGLLRWREAEAWYASVPRGEGHDQATLRRAGALARLARLPEALASLRALRSDEEADGEAIRDAFLLESDLLERRGRGDEALAVLDESLEVFEGDPALRYARAMLHERAGRLDEALADLQLILDEEPDSHQALNAYGYALLVRRDQPAQALPYLERAFELAPESAAVLDSLGWLRFRMGEPELALELLQKAWERQRMAEIAAHLGEVLWTLGRKAEAREIWRAGLRLGGSDDTLDETLDRLLGSRTP